MTDLFPLPIDTPPFKFSERRVDPSRNKIYVDGQWIKVEPRVMHVLVCLASRPGQVVSRHDLIDVVWPDCVVNEDSLTRAVSDLRRALAGGQGTKLIETIRKGGYCLTGVVESLDLLTDDQESSTETNNTRRRGFLRGYRITLLVAVVACCCLLGFAFVLFNNNLSSTAIVTGRPLTNSPGPELHPALSPNGALMAYTQDTGSGTGMDIYVAQCDGGSPLRVTSAIGQELSPTWSPDASLIAYIQVGQKSSIYISPAMGGTPRWIADIEGRANGLDWSPDGLYLAYSKDCTGCNFARIAVLDIKAGTSKEVSLPAGKFVYDVDPAWSPDGKQLVFTRSHGTFFQNLYTVDFDSKQEQQLTTGIGKVFGSDWTRDGKHIVYGGAEQGDSQLWRLTLADGVITRLPCQSKIASRPNLATNTDRLVFEDYATRINISLLDWHQPETGFYPIANSTRSDFRSVFAPVGEQLAFISARSGTQEVYVAAASESAARQISHFEGLPVLGLSWSPDAQYIAVAVLAETRFQIRILDIAGSRVVAPAALELDEQVLLWSADGRWLYLAVGPEHDSTYRRVSPDGETVEELNWPVLKYVCQSLSGEIFGQMYDGSIIRWQPQADGWEMVCGKRQGQHLGMVAVEEGVLCSRRVGSQVLLDLVSLESGAAETICELPKSTGEGLSVSANGETLAITSIDQESDIILVEEFH